MGISGGLFGGPAGEQRKDAAEIGPVPVLFQALEASPRKDERNQVSTPGQFLILFFFCMAGVGIVVERAMW